MNTVLLIVVALVVLALLMWVMYLMCNCVFMYIYFVCSGVLENLIGAFVWCLSGIIDGIGGAISG
jgi:hypothetical protein